MSRAPDAAPAAAVAAAPAATTPQPIVEALLSEAQANAERIIAETRASLAARAVSLAERENRIAAEATARAEQEAERIRRQALGAAAVEARRIELELERTVLNTVTKRVREQLAAMVGTPAYEHVLADWVVEGALALAPAATLILRTSAVEREQAARAMQTAIATLRARGMDVALTIDPATLPTGDQGVVITDTASPRAFSNRIADRMRRLDEAIRTIVDAAKDHSNG